MKDSKSTIKVYIAQVLVALGIVLLVCGLQGLLTQQKSPQETARICCDAFFVAGVVILGGGALSWCNTKGAFDGLGYSVSYAIHLRVPSKGSRMNWKKAETYDEYVERKHKKDDKKHFLHMICVGTVLIVVAVICLVVYHTY